MFESMIETLKANPRKIVFTEGPDARILEAASRLKKDGFLTPILVGNVEEVTAAAKAGNFDIEGLEILDPATYPAMEDMVEKMVELRKGKMTASAGRCHLFHRRYHPSRSAAGQDQEGRPSGVLLLHSGPWGREAGHGRLRHQH